LEKDELKAVMEGLLFTSGDAGITIQQIKDILQIDKNVTHDVIAELTDDYKALNHGVMITQSEQVYYLTTKPEHSSYYKKFLETPPATKLSQAALETLAIIAYSQPITRTEIDDIRGVKSDRSVQTLLNRVLIEEAGKKESIGKPVLFATSKYFLTYFGLTSLEDLPPLPESSNLEGVNEEADVFFQRFHDEIKDND